MPSQRRAQTATGRDRSRRATRRGKCRAAAIAETAAEQPATAAIGRRIISRRQTGRDRRSGASCGMLGLAVPLPDDRPALPKSLLPALGGTRKSARFFGRAKRGFGLIDAFLLFGVRV